MFSCRLQDYIWYKPFFIYIKIGQMVSSRASDKITKITDNIYCLRSGSAADTQTVASYTNNYLNYLSYLINLNLY